MIMSLTLSHPSSSFTTHHHNHSRNNPSTQRATYSFPLQISELKQRRVARNLVHKYSCAGTLINGDATDTTDHVSSTTTLRVKEVVRRNQGDGETSYTNHSLFQRVGMVSVKAVVEDSLKEVYWSIRPECLIFADLGCSSFSPLWEVAETVRKESRRLWQRPPDVQAFFNYLPRNDVFRSFHDKEPDFGTASFLGRLFPDISIHFFHSSFTLNWLSQVPKRLVSEDGKKMNKGNICVGKSSPIWAQGAYSTQFESDFTNFLKSRSKEIKPGGRMVIAMMGSNINDKSHNIWELLGATLNDMASEGLVQESTLDSFNLPLHTPCREEVRIGIQKEGSFRLLRLETWRTNWDGDTYYNVTNNIVGRNKYDNFERGKQMSMTLRAAGGSILSAHFGIEVTDALFRRHAKKVADYLDSVGQGLWTTHVVSLIED